MSLERSHHCPFPHSLGRNVVICPHQRHLIDLYPHIKSCRSHQQHQPSQLWNLESLFHRKLKQHLRSTIWTCSWERNVIWMMVISKALFENYHLFQNHEMNDEIVTRKSINLIGMPIKDSDSHRNMHRANQSI